MIAATKDRWRSWRLSQWSLRLFGLLILWLVLRQIDLGQVADMMRLLRPGPLIAAVVLTVPFFAVKSWRWRLILQRMGIRIKYREAFQLYGVGLLVGQATPGQVGEVARAHFLWRRGHDPVLATGSVLTDRALDMLFLGLVAVPGLGLLVNTGAALALLAAVLSAFVAVIMLRPRRLSRLVLARFYRGPRARQLAGRIDELLGALEMMLRTPATASLIASSTVLALALNLLRIYLLLVALGLSLPVASFVFGVSLANLAGLLPITVSGIGVRDAVLVLVFQQAGQPPEGAIALSLLILMAYLLNLAWGFVAWVLETR